MSSPLKIDILCNDGSPLGTVFSDIYGENDRLGLGGAELALHTLANAWVEAGHTVRMFNSPRYRKVSPYEQYTVDSFSPRDDRDILIVFRSPNSRIKKANGKIIWWSCDQYTVGSFSDFAPKVHKIVTISPFHAEHFQKVYGIGGTYVIDLPVRVTDYDYEIEKVPNRLLFCSVPDRGLSILADCYPRIKKEVPDLSLTITSDYRLWGADSPRNEQHVARFLGMAGVKFLGAIPRKELVKEQMVAQIQTYPCTYDELFCYAVAECQVAGTLPITSSMGALVTTNMGVQITGNPSDRLWKDVFVDMVIQHLGDSKITDKQNKLRTSALERFSLMKILEQWDGIFYND